MVLMQKPSMIDAPSGGAPEQAPRWDLTGTEGCGGGIRFLAPYLVVWGYVGIYRRKEYVGGVQVSWIMFGEKITFPKVSFRLDSV